MFNRVFLIFFLLFTIANVCAEPPVPVESKALSGKIAALFKDEKFEEGFALFKDNCSFPPEELETLLKTINKQWSEIISKRYGTSISIELVKEEKISNCFLRYTYLHKLQNHALKWTFVFYKPKEVWLMNAVTYDDKVDTLFK